MLFKTIKYYLATNAEMRASDRAAFRALWNDMQKKRIKLEEVKTELSHRGGCVHRYLKKPGGIWSEILPGKIVEKHCERFWIKHVCITPSMQSIAMCIVSMPRPRKM